MGGRCCAPAHDAERQTQLGEQAHGRPETAGWGHPSPLAEKPGRERSPQKQARSGALGRVTGRMARGSSPLPMCHPWSELASWAVTPWFTTAGIGQSC